MTKHPSAAGHDAAVTTFGEDLLNGVGVARAIHRAIQGAPSTWSTRIGLYGQWGSGKTSILNLLRILEEEEGSLVVSFSAWSANSESNVIALFYKALAKKLDEKATRLPVLQRARQSVDRLKSVAPFVRVAKKGTVEFLPLSPAMTKVATGVLDALAEKAASWVSIGREDLRKISDLLNGRRVVVFIDDLDRTDPKQIPKALLALRELLDWPGFSFVLAFDKRAISSALSEYSQAFGDDAQGFLEKVIDIPFEVPDVEWRFKTAFAVRVFGLCCPALPSDELKALIPMLPAQPRRVKLIARMIGSLQPSLERHDIDAVDWLGVGLYMFVREAGEDLARWVVRRIQTDDVDWETWGADNEERQKKRVELRQEISEQLDGSIGHAEFDRQLKIVEKLLEHWAMRESAHARYWVGICYSEPAFTLREVRLLADAYTEHLDEKLVPDAIERAGSIAAQPLRDVSKGLLDKAIELYQLELNGMAESETEVEYGLAFERAKSRMLFLKYLSKQQVSMELLELTRLGGFGAELISSFTSWVSWTRNDGDVHLRAEEKALVHAACKYTYEPEILFAQTDPFWNSYHTQDARSAQMVDAWRKEIRELLIPSVVSGLVAQFGVVGALSDVSDGTDNVGAWFVENAKSPLYENHECTLQLRKVFESHANLPQKSRTTLARDALTYLRQILCQTRQASWAGEGGGAKEIIQKCPSLISSAWAAATCEAVPFRMRSSFTTLKGDLLKAGAKEEEVPDTPWMQARRLEG